MRWVGGNQGSRNIYAFVVVLGTTDTTPSKHTPSPPPPPASLVLAFENTLQTDLRQFEKPLGFVYKLKVCFWGLLTEYINIKNWVQVKAIQYP